MIGKLFSRKDKQAEKHLAIYAEFCSETEIEQITERLFAKTHGVSYSSFGISKELVLDQTYPILHSVIEDKKDLDFIDTINLIAKRHFEKKIFEALSLDAINRLSNFMTMTDSQAKIISVLLHQFFSIEPLNILVIADKEAHINSLVELFTQMHPHATTQNLKESGSYRTLAPEFVKSKLVKPGLLAEYNEGLITLTDAHTQYEKYKDLLAESMFEETLTYNINSKVFKLPTKTTILAITNPNTGHFVGKAVGLYKQQLPVKEEFRDLFHMLVCIRCPEEQFMTQRQYSETDLEFVQDYISYASSLQVLFPPKFKQHVIDWHKLVMSKQKEYIPNLDDNLVITLIRIAVAHARMHLRDEVSLNDLKYAMDILEESLGLMYV